METSNKYKIYIFLLFYFFILIYPLKFVPLFETTEARYSEIAREMVVSGDYIEPRFNGIKHFHKPPFAYWMMAFGIEIFGNNGLGARFFGVVAAVISVLILFKMVKFFDLDEEDGFNVALIYASSMLFLAISRIASTDIYLTMWTVVAQYFLFRHIYHRKDIYNSIGYGVALGFGFLTKGPIIFLFTLLPFFVAKFFDEKHRKVFKPFEILISVFMFFGVALPWYIAVILKNPDLLDYFLKVQTVDRVVTNRFHRYKPFYFFFFVFLGGFIPYSLYFGKSLINFKALESKFRGLIIYVVAPFIVFSIAKSKLATYILPFFPVASVVAYVGFKRFDSKIIRYFSVLLLFLLVFAAMFSGYFYKPLNPYKHTLVLYGILLMLTIAPAIINLDNEKFVKSVAFTLISVSFVVYMVLPTIGPNIKGYRLMSYKLNEIDPKREINVLAYKTFVPSVSFYRNRLISIAYGKKRETQFEYDDNYKKYYLTSDKDIKKFVDENGKFFLITRPKYLTEFTKKFKVECEEVFSQRKHSAYLCKRLNQ